MVNNSVIFKSASKSFNLSALKCSWIYSENPSYIQRIAATGHSSDINTLGVVAAHAALTQGEPWLNQLIAYIDGNHDFTASFIQKQIPLLSYSKPQATYLAWVDVSRLIEKIGAQAQADQANLARPNAAKPITAEIILQDWLVQHAKVQLNAGTNYGRAGAGRMRMNLGASRQTLHLALSSIAAALQKL
ncbi:MAG: aminotransferase class I/II-fold pyridoxal phosphate-dependent enzyme [bacterium]